MDLHFKQEVTVGALVLLGVGLFFGGTLWLRGKRFSSGEKEVHIAFKDAGTLKRGSAVRVSGVNLGAVEEIVFRGVGDVLVTVSMKPLVAPRIDASAELATVGLVADAVINFNPGNASTPLPEDQIIQGTIDQGFMELGTELGGQAKQTLEGINKIATERLANNLNATLEAMQRFVNTYSNPRAGPVAEMTSTMQSLQRLSARLDSSLAQANLGATLRKSDTLITTLSTTSASFTTTTSRLDSLLQKVNRGDGSLGRLVNDTLLYQDIRRVAQSLEKLVDEIRKNPGKITIQIKAF